MRKRIYLSTVQTSYWEGGELVIREDMALASISAGSAVEFSLDEMQQLLRRCVEECEIMRSRGNIYFV